MTTITESPDRKHAPTITAIDIVIGIGIVTTACRRLLHEWTFKCHIGITGLSSQYRKQGGGSAIAQTS